MSIADKNIEKLKEEATSLGIEFHHNTGELKLQELIEDAKLLKESDKFMKGSEPKAKDTDTIEPKTIKPKPVIEKTLAQKRQQKKREQSRLIRVIIHCNNDDKKEWNGDTIKVCNKLVGSITRYIDFDNDNGIHIPQIMLNVLNEKLCQKFRNVVQKSGETVKMPFMTKEYTIEVLPPLNAKELKDLADDQRARGAID